MEATSSHETNKVLLLLVGAGLFGVPVAREGYRIARSALVPWLQEQGALGVWWLISYCYFLALLSLLLTAAKSISAKRIVVSFDGRLALAALILTCALVVTDPLLVECLRNRGLAGVEYLLWTVSFQIVLKTVTYRVRRPDTEADASYSR